MKYKMNHSDWLEYGNKIDGQSDLIYCFTVSPLFIQCTPFFPHNGRQRVWTPFSGCIPSNAHSTFENTLDFPLKCQYTFSSVEKSMFSIYLIPINFNWIVGAKYSHYIHIVPSIRKRSDVEITHK